MYWKIRDYFYIAATKTRALLYAILFLVLTAVMLKFFSSESSVMLQTLAIAASCFYYNRVVDYYFLAQISDIRRSTRNEIFFIFFLSLFGICFVVATVLGVCRDNADCLRSFVLISVQLIFSVVTYFNIGIIMADSCARTDFSNKKQIKRDRRLVLEIRRCKRKYVGVPYNTQNFTGARDWQSMASVIILSICSVCMFIATFLDIMAGTENIIFSEEDNIFGFYGLAFLALFFTTFALLAINFFVVTFGAKACIFISILMLATSVDLLSIAAKAPFYITCHLVSSKIILLEPLAFQVLSVLLLLYVFGIYIGIVLYFYKHWDNRKTKLNWNTHKDRVMLEWENASNTQHTLHNKSFKSQKVKQKNTKGAHVCKVKKRRLR